MNEDYAHSTLQVEWRPALAVRLAWTIASVGIVESMVFGLSAVPAVFCFELVGDVPLTVEN